MILRKILKYRIEIRHVNRDEAERELKDFNPKLLNLVSVNENTPCGHYVDFTDPQTSQWD